MGNNNFYSYCSCFINQVFNSHSIFIYCYLISYFVFVFFLQIRAQEWNVLSQKSVNWTINVNRYADVEMPVLWNLPQFVDRMERRIQTSVLCVKKHVVHGDLFGSSTEENVVLVSYLRFSLTTISFKVFIKYL